ncbi:hypothetical protein C8A00DRAFT_30347 [Chaetomidium leptoderma]|uniref:Uncharacterized protein n=1 Tax=Chaetomidium leptoderma TaxID=669021 RepID=A0AAN6VV68_9PEZI|nr:hypothetical protein C8A00DRAFT_30347 [Chaetomidium leptoderma]
MARPARSKAKAVQIDGRTYHPERPRSEQDDVRRITGKFKSVTPARAAEVEITEEELRNFAKVYLRLYKVPKKTQDRLAAWREGNQDEIQGWDVGDFFTAKDDDDDDQGGPGPFEAALQELEEQREEEEAPTPSGRQRPKQLQELEERREEEDAPAPVGRRQRPKRPQRRVQINRDDGGSDAEGERQETDEDVLDQLVVSAGSANQGQPRPAAAGVRFPQQSITKNDATPSNKLEAALGSIKGVADSLKHLSAGADDRDPYKKALFDLAYDLDTYLERAHQAKQGMVDRPDGPSLGLSKRSHQGLDEEDEENETDRIIHAKRARAVDSLRMAKVEQNAMAQRHPQELGAINPRYQGGGHHDYGPSSSSHEPPRGGFNAEYRTRGYDDHPSNMRLPPLPQTMHHNQADRYYNPDVAYGASTRPDNY